MVHVVMLLKFKGAKSRLSPFLSLSQRLSITGMCASHVLKCSYNYPVIIITPESVGETYNEDDNINAGISLLRKTINDDIVILTSDLPLLLPSCIKSLIGKKDTIGIAQSHNGGTSGLFIPKGARFETHFGPKSAISHKKEAQKNGFSANIIESECFHDIDTMQDIMWVKGKNRDYSEYFKHIGIISGV